jgi:hypothetical protein
MVSARSMPTAVPPAATPITRVAETSSLSVLVPPPLRRLASVSSLSFVGIDGVRSRIAVLLAFGLIS